MHSLGRVTFVLSHTFPHFPCEVHTAQPTLLDRWDLYSLPFLLGLGAHFVLGSEAFHPVDRAFIDLETGPVMQSLYFNRPQGRWMKTSCGCDKHQCCQDIQPVPSQGENSCRLGQWPGHLGSRCPEDCLCQELPVGKSRAGGMENVSVELPQEWAKDGPTSETQMVCSENLGLKSFFVLSLTHFIFKARCHAQAGLECELLITLFLPPRFWCDSKLPHVQFPFIGKKTNYFFLSPAFLSEGVSRGALLPA